MTVLVAYGSKRGGTEGLAHTVAEAFRETEKAFGFTLPNADGRRIDVYVPKSQSRVLPNGRVYVAPWLKHATLEKQGVQL